MASTDPFYEQRANDVQAAIAAGDTDRAAALVTHVLIEEGPTGLDTLTDAVKRTQPE